MCCNENCQIMTPFCVHHTIDTPWRLQCIHLVQWACITNLMGHVLAIIIAWNLFFIGLCGIHMNVINLFMLFEHWYCAHCLETNVICLFVSFKHICCMFIHVVYTQKLYTWLSCLNNAMCLTNTNLCNNKFRIDLEWTHGVCKFVWCVHDGVKVIEYCMLHSIVFYFFHRM